MADGGAPPDLGPFAQSRSEVEQRQIAAALGLLQRLPPKDLEANLESFSKIAPHLDRTLEPYVTRPLQVKRDDEQNRYFIACEYNSDGGSHRSPWSNKYFPAPAPGGGGDAEEDKLNAPTGRLRLLEKTFNEVFDAYKTGYYEGGVSSVYLWDLDEGFGGAFLIRKELPALPGLSKGVWDSVHLVEARESASQANLTEYKLTASVRMWVQVVDSSKSDTNLDAWITRTVETRGSRGKKVVGDEIHLHHIGRMIEDTEIRIRQHLECVNVAKQREVLQACRLPEDPDDDEPLVSHRVTRNPSVSSLISARAQAAAPAAPSIAKAPGKELKKGVSFGGVEVKGDGAEITER